MAGSAARYGGGGRPPWCRISRLSRLRRDISPAFYWCPHLAGGISWGYAAYVGKGSARQAVGTRPQACDGASRRRHLDLTTGDVAALPVDDHHGHGLGFLDGAHPCAV